MRLAVGFYGRLLISHIAKGFTQENTCNHSSGLSYYCKLLSSIQCRDKLFFNYLGEEGEAFSLQVPEMVKLCSHIARSRYKTGNGFILSDSTK